jgi:hypothetical protein
MQHVQANAVSELDRKTQYVACEPVELEHEDDIHACVRGFVDAVVAGAHDTLPVFVARFLADRDEGARVRLIPAIERTLSALSVKTCAALGISVRTCAAFKRLRSYPNHSGHS